MPASTTGSGARTVSPKFFDSLVGIFTAKPAKTSVWFYLTQPAQILIPALIGSFAVMWLFTNKALIPEKLSIFQYFSDVRVMGYFGMLVWIHEASHVIQFLRFKIPVFQLLASPIAGFSIPAREAEPGQEVDIALAGPLSAFAALPVLVLGAVINDHWLVGMAFGWFAINALNLLPFYPLDGGVVVKAVLCKFFTPKTARRIAWGITILGLGSLSLLPNTNMAWVLQVTMLGSLWLAEIVDRAIYKRFSKRFGITEKTETDTTLTGKEALDGVVKYLTITGSLVVLAILSWAILVR